MVGGEGRVAVEHLDSIGCRREVLIRNPRRPKRTAIAGIGDDKVTIRKEWLGGEDLARRASQYIDGDQLAVTGRLDRGRKHLTGNPAAAFPFQRRPRAGTRAGHVPVVGSFLIGQRARRINRSRRRRTPRRR
jgi:hypothetical protein